MKRKNLAPKPYERLERKYYVEMTPTLGRVNVPTNAYIIMHQFAKEHERLKSEHLAECPQDAFNPDLDKIIARKLTLEVKRSQYNRQKNIPGEIHYDIHSGLQPPQVKKKSHRLLKLIIVLGILAMAVFVWYLLGNVVFTDLLP